MSDGERIATLEAQRVDIVDRLDSQDEDLRAIRDDVHSIKTSLAGYKGFFAGASFAIAALAGVIGAGLTALWSRLFGQ